MHRDTITDKNSAQYEISRYANTDDTGVFCLDDNGRYLVAIGTGYDAPVGTFVDVKLDTEIVIECTVGDIKADIHTDESNSYKSMTDKSGNVILNADGEVMVNVLEFIVSDVTEDMKTYGCVSHVNENLKGNVKEMRVYE